MAEKNLWSVYGGTNTVLYRIFDTARNILNRRLATYLYQRLEGSSYCQLKTLEAGSGPGFCSSVLSVKEGVASAMIVDIDRSALNIAVRRCRNIRTIQADLYKMPFEDESFDLVFNSSTLEHLISFDHVFREMVRITKPKGKIFVGVPYKYGPFIPFNLIAEKNRVSVWMGKLYSVKELRDACVKDSLVLEDIFFYFFRCFVGILISKQCVRIS